jgi:CRP/FNR family transcriptional regulator, cyclic AMP receptor protein
MAQPFAELRPYRPGAELIAQGGRTGTMYVLKSGHIEVVRDGVSVVVIDQPGAIFGEISVLLDVPNSATVRAIGPAEVYVIENAAMALSTRPEWAMQIAKILARRVVSTTTALVESRQSVPNEVYVLPGETVMSFGDPAV